MSVNYSYETIRSSIIACTKNDKWTLLIVDTYSRMRFFINMLRQKLSLVMFHENFTSI